MSVVETKNTVASEEEQKRFDELLSDSNKKAITHVITLKLTDFVDMQEFNSMQISAGEFNEKRVEYIKEHSKANDVQQIAYEFANKLAEIGLFKESIKLQARPYDIGHSLLSELKSLIANGITPPRRTAIIPKLVSCNNALQSIG